MAGALPARCAGRQALGPTGGGCGSRGGAPAVQLAAVVQREREALLASQLSRVAIAGGPYPFGSGSLVVWLCIHSTAPAPRCCRCGGWTGRGTLCLRLPAAWPCPAPLTDTRCTHVRAGLLLLLAVVRPTTGSLLPSPPAACSVSTRGAPRVTTDNWVGGWEKLHWLDVATVSAALAVVTLAWGCAAPNRSSEVSSSVLVRCRC